MTKSMFIFHTQFVFFIRILLTKFLPHHNPPFLLINVFKLQYPHSFQTYFIKLYHFDVNYAIFFYKIFLYCVFYYLFTDYLSILLYISADRLKD